MRRSIEGVHRAIGLHSNFPKRIIHPMKPRVYVETSVISYLTNRPALDVITAGHQATTLQWWDKQRGHYELAVSQFVLDEASAGDPVAAESELRRLKILHGLIRSAPKSKRWLWLF